MDNRVLDFRGYLSSAWVLKPGRILCDVHTSLVNRIVLKKSWDIEKCSQENVILAKHRGEIWRNNSET